MTGISSDRITTARLIGKCLATRSGRRLLDHNGYESGAPIVASEWDTPVDDVISEVRAATKTAQAVIAIRRGEDLYWMGFSPATSSERANPVSGASTIGMLYQAVEQAANPWDVRVTTMSQARVLLPA